ncbi:MAG TPA: hypothetical protein ACFCUC_14125 [Desulfobacterales bacterium]
MYKPVPWAQRSFNPDMSFFPPARAVPAMAAFSGGALLRSFEGHLHSRDMDNPRRPEMHISAFQWR